MAVPVDRPGDEQLRDLLATERRLQALVCSAKEEASRRVAAASTAGEERRVAAASAAEAQNAARARAERVEHEQALEAIWTAHRAALATMAGLPDSRIDALAEWAFVQALGDMEGSS